MEPGQHTFFNSANTNTERQLRYKPTSDEIKNLFLFSASFALPTIMPSFFFNLLGAITLQISPWSQEEQIAVSGQIGTVITYLLCAPLISWIYFFVSTNFSDNPQIKKLVAKYNNASDYEQTIYSTALFILFSETYSLIGNIIGFGVISPLYPSSTLTASDMVSASTIGTSYFMGIIALGVGVSLLYKYCTAHNSFSTSVSQNNESHDNDPLPAAPALMA